MAKILSCASCLSSYSIYLSQKGCAKKSRPTEVAARSKSLEVKVSKDENDKGGWGVRVGRRANTEEEGFVQATIPIPNQSVLRRRV